MNDTDWRKIKFTLHSTDVNIPVVKHLLRQGVAQANSQGDPYRPHNYTWLDSIKKQGVMRIFTYGAYYDIETMQKSMWRSWYRWQNSK